MSIRARSGSRPTSRRPPDINTACSTATSSRSGSAFGASGSDLTITFSVPISGVAFTFALDDPRNTTTLSFRTDGGAQDSASGDLTSGYRYPEGTFSYTGSPFTMLTLHLRRDRLPDRRPEGYDHDGAGTRHVGAVRPGRRVARCAASAPPPRRFRLTARPRTSQGEDMSRINPHGAAWLATACNRRDRTAGRLVLGSHRACRDQPARDAGAADGPAGLHPQRAVGRPGR